MPGKKQARVCCFNWKMLMVDYSKTNKQTNNNKTQPANQTECFIWNDSNRIMLYIETK